VSPDDGILQWWRCYSERGERLMVRAATEATARSRAVEQWRRNGMRRGVSDARPGHEKEIAEHEASVSNLHRLARCDRMKRWSPAEDAEAKARYEASRP
jgi:hypothetical protein